MAARVCYNPGVLSYLLANPDQLTGGRTAVWVVSGVRAIVRHLELSKQVLFFIFYSLLCVSPQLQFHTRVFFGAPPTLNGHIPVTDAGNLH